MMAYKELRGDRNPAEEEAFRAKSRGEAKEDLEKWSIMPSDAQWKFFSSLMSQLGNTMDEATKKDMRAAACECKADMHRVLKVLKADVAALKGEHDGRSFV